MEHQTSNIEQIGGYPVLSRPGLSFADLPGEAHVDFGSRIDEIEAEGLPYPAALRRLLCEPLDQKTPLFLWIGRHSYPFYHFFDHRAKPESYDILEPADLGYDQWVGTMVECNIIDVNELDTAGLDYYVQIPAQHLMEMFVEGRRANVIFSHQVFTYEGGENGLGLNPVWLNRALVQCFYSLMPGGVAFFSGGEGSLNVTAELLYRAGFSKVVFVEDDRDLQGYIAYKGTS